MTYVLPEIRFMQCYIVPSSPSGMELIIACDNSIVFFSEIYEVNLFYTTVVCILDSWKNSERQWKQSFERKNNVGCILPML